MLVFRIFLATFGIIGFIYCYRLKVTIGAVLNQEYESLRPLLEQSLREHRSQDVILDIATEIVDWEDPFHVAQAVTRLLRKQVVIFLTPSISKDFSILLSFSNNVQIPVISFSGPELVDKHVVRYGVTLKPNTLMAVLDVMRFYRWNSVIYVFDNERGPEKLQYLLERGSQALDIKIRKLIQIRTSDEALQLLRKLEVEDRGSIKRVLLDVGPSLAKDILVNFGRHNQGPKKSFHFLLTEPVDDDFWSNYKTDLSLLNITGFQLYNSNSENVNSFIKTKVKSQQRKITVTDLLLAQDSVRLLAATFQRLANNQIDGFNINMGSNGRSSFNATYNARLEKGQIISQYLRETLIPDSMTGKLQFDTTGQRRDFSVDVIETTPESNNKAFIWSDTSGLKVMSPAYPPVQTDIQDILNRTITVSSILQPPFLMMTGGSYSKTGNDRFSGFLRDLLDIVKDILKCDYVIKLVKDGRYGRLTKDKGWNGLVGEVLRHEADMAVGDLTVTAERQEAVDLVPYMAVGISLMIKKPSVRGTDVGPGSSAYFFLHAFSKEVWACALVSYVIIGGLLFVVARLTGAPIKAGESEFSPERGKFSILSSLWFVFGSFFFRGSGIYPRSVSTRWVSGIWWVFTFFLGTLYLSNLASQLIVSSLGFGPTAQHRILMSRDIHALLQEAAESGIPQIGTITGGATFQFFRHSQIPTYKILGQTMDTNPELLANSLQEGLDRVRMGNGMYAFLTESSVNEYYGNREPCDTFMVPETIMKRSFGFAVAKGSPFRKALTKAILAIQESSDYDALYRKWWPNECAGENDSRSFKDLYHSSLTLKEVSGLFYFLISGCILTAVVTGTEWYITNRRLGRHAVSSKVAVNQMPSKANVLDSNGTNVDPSVDLIQSIF